MDMLKEEAERARAKEGEALKRYEYLQKDYQELQATLEVMKRQVEVAQSNKIELSAKLELAQQKIANLDRENMKLYKINLENKQP